MKYNGTYLNEDEAYNVYIEAFEKVRTNEFLNDGSLDGGQLKTMKELKERLEDLVFERVWEK